MIREPTSSPRPDDEFDDRRWKPGVISLVAALVVVLAVAGAGVWLLVSDDDPAATPVTADDVAQLGAAREIVDGVPVGFSHDQPGAISAAATWTAHAFVYPARYRAPGIEAVFLDSAEPIDPDGPLDDRVIAVTPLAVRGEVEGNSGVVEVLAVTTGDFLSNGVPGSTSLFSASTEIVSVTLSWSDVDDDWRIASWDRTPLETTQLTAGLLSGFQWVRPTGALLTSTPIGVLE